MTPRARLSIVAFIAVALAAMSTYPQASDQGIAVIRFGATIGGATSLQLSSSQLVIDPRREGQTGPVVIGSVEFLARARTHTGGEVVLSVEALQNPASLGGGASEGVTSIDFEGSGEGAVGGVLRASPETAGRWRGSGRRSGRLTFTLRGPGPSAGAVVPLRFVLSTP
jgi:hypothetical protein